MIKVRAVRDGQHVEEVPVADLAAVRAQEGTLIWVDVASPTPAELAELGAEFGIHEVALEDLQVDERQRPKVEQYHDQVVLVFYGAVTGTDGRPTRLFELDLLAGRNYPAQLPRGRADRPEDDRRTGQGPPRAGQRRGRLPAVCRPRRAGRHLLPGPRRHRRADRRGRGGGPGR
jgi:CorA-like Mg2+ transporter protein